MSSRYSMVRALSAIERADVCVILIDAGRVTEQDTRIAGLAHDSGKASVIVVNKLVGSCGQGDRHHGNHDKDSRDKFPFMAYAPVIFISAKTGQRVDKLFEKIKEVSDNAGKRLTTGVLNQMITEAVTMVPTPQDKGQTFEDLLRYSGCGQSRRRSRTLRER